MNIKALIEEVKYTKEGRIGQLNIYCNTGEYFLQFRIYSRKYIDLRIHQECTLQKVDK